MKRPKGHKMKADQNGHTHLLQDVQIVVSHNYAAYCHTILIRFSLVKKAKLSETNTFL